MREPFLKYVENELGSDFLLIACGLPGTWKTETTEEVARVTGYTLLRSDLIRLELLKNEDVFDEKVAADMDKRTMVYDEMFRQAEETLDKRGGGVILDATFVTQSLRRRAAAIAAGRKCRFIILQTDCPQEVAIRRILARTKDDYSNLADSSDSNNPDNSDDADQNDGPDPIYKSGHQEDEPSTIYRIYYAKLEVKDGTGVIESDKAQVSVQLK